MSRFSLADELSAALDLDDDDGGAGAHGASGGLSLAEEFGLDLGGGGLANGEEEDQALDTLDFALDDVHDPAFSQPLEDDEPHAGLFGSHAAAYRSPPLDDGGDPELAQLYAPDSGSPETSLDGRRALGRRANGQGSPLPPTARGVASSSSSHPARFAHDVSDGEEPSGTPTRPGRGGRARASSRRGRRVRSLALRSVGGAALAEDDDGRLSSGFFSGSDDAGAEPGMDDPSLSPRMLFHPSSSSSAAELDPLAPSPLLALLQQGDRSFALEQQAAALVLRVEDAVRAMEGRNRELDGLGRALGPLADAGALRTAAGDEGERRGLDVLQEEEEEEGEETELDVADDDDDDGFYDGADSNSSTGPSTPLAQRALRPVQALFTPPNSSSASPFALPPSAPLLAPLLPPLAALASQSTALAEALALTRDQSQIALSLGADASRRARVARLALTSMRAEEEGVTRAGRGVREWEEEGRAARGGVKERVGREMEGFQRAMQEFEERTLVIRQTHQAFLVGAAG